MEKEVEKTLALKKVQNDTSVLQKTPNNLTKSAFVEENDLEQKAQNIKVNFGNYIENICLHGGFVATPLTLKSVKIDAINSYKEEIKRLRKSNLKREDINLAIGKLNEAITLVKSDSVGFSKSIYKSLFSVGKDENVEKIYPQQFVMFLPPATYFTDSKVALKNKYEISSFAFFRVFTVDKQSKQIITKDALSEILLRDLKFAMLQGKLGLCCKRDFNVSLSAVNSFLMHFRGGLLGINIARELIPMPGDEYDYEFIRLVMAKRAEQQALIDQIRKMRDIETAKNLINSDKNVKKSQKTSTMSDIEHNKKDLPNEDQNSVTTNKLLSRASRFVNYGNRKNQDKEEELLRRHLEDEEIKKADRMRRDDLINRIMGLNGFPDAKENYYRQQDATSLDDFHRALKHEFAKRYPSHAWNKDPDKDIDEAMGNNRRPEYDHNRRREHDRESERLINTHTEFKHEIAENNPKNEVNIETNLGYKEFERHEGDVSLGRGWPSRGIKNPQIERVDADELDRMRRENADILGISEEFGPKDVSRPEPPAPAVEQMPSQSMEPVLTLKKHSPSRTSRM